MGGKVAQQSRKIMFVTICKHLARAHLCTEIPLKIAIIWVTMQRFLLTFRDNLSVPYSSVKNRRLDSWPCSGSMQFTVQTVSSLTHLDHNSPHTTSVHIIPQNHNWNNNFNLLKPSGFFTDLRASHSKILRRWVKNYPQCRYIFCSWLYCWLRMTR
jgi:hypothetical protein